MRQVFGGDQGSLLGIWRTIELDAAAGADQFDTFEKYQ
jgi:hypothetical protein